MCVRDAYSRDRRARILCDRLSLSFPPACFKSCRRRERLRDTVVQASALPTAAAMQAAGAVAVAAGPTVTMAHVCQHRRAMAQLAGQCRSRQQHNLM